MFIDFTLSNGDALLDCAPQTFACLLASNSGNLEMAGFWVSQIVTCDNLLKRRFLLRSIQHLIQMSSVSFHEEQILMLLKLTEEPFDMCVDVRVELVHFLVELVRFESHSSSMNSVRLLRYCKGIIAILGDYSSDSQRGDIGCRSRYAALCGLEEILVLFSSSNWNHIYREISLAIVPALLKIYVETNFKLRTKAVSVLKLSGHHLPVEAFLRLTDDRVLDRYSLLLLVYESTYYVPLLEGFGRFCISPTFDEDVECGILLDFFSCADTIKVIPVIVEKLALFVRELSLQSAVVGQAFLRLTDDRVLDRYSLLLLVYESTYYVPLLEGFGRFCISPTFDEDVECGILLDFFSCADTIKVIPVIVEKLALFVRELSLQSAVVGLFRFLGILIDLPSVGNLDPVLSRLVFDSTWSFCKISNTCSTRIVAVQILATLLRQDGRTRDDSIKLMLQFLLSKHKTVRQLTAELLYENLMIISPGSRAISIILQENW
eukprot:TRINITY_DN4820_c0_g1_i1.p1 TRINITY_DN4820_c0_g1~~TRINITY_DN4820_c0_g1_i1.p1  ORF type:complete len:490 (+),score=79.37 TRINITY_DN4820_c0_g1_i1:181-1650(+)